jgi:class 3 adenylate cyclase
VDAIFGFCDIRQFTDVTECLQEEVMVFVNQIGKIVHSAVHRLGGAANKNIGACDGVSVY